MIREKYITVKMKLSKQNVPPKVYNKKISKSSEKLLKFMSVLFIKNVSSSSFPFLCKAAGSVCVSTVSFSFLFSFFFFSNPKNGAFFNVEFPSHFLSTSIIRKNSLIFLFISLLLASFFFPFFFLSTFLCLSFLCLFSMTKQLFSFFLL